MALLSATNGPDVIVTVLTAVVHAAVAHIDDPGAVGVVGVGTGGLVIEALDVNKRMATRQCRIVAIAVHQALQLLAVGQPPVVLAAQPAAAVESGYPVERPLPGARSGKISVPRPDQAGQIVGYAVAVGRETGIRPRRAGAHVAVLAGAGTTDDRTRRVVTGGLAGAGELDGAGKGGAGKTEEQKCGNGNLLDHG